jgi:type I restriction enzyme S subunit
MFVSRPAAALIRGRLDAEAYNPEFLGAAEALSESGLSVESVDDVSERIRCGPFGSSLHASRYVEDGVPFLAPVAFSGGHIDIDAVERITKADHDRLQGTSFRPPTIVFARVGHPHVAAVPESFGEFNIHGDVIGAKLSDDNDAHFMYSYFTCAHGGRLLRQAQAGTTRPRINTPDLAVIPVVKPSSPIQRYIGSKVRQAEALREWARLQDAQVASTLDAVLPGISITPRAWNRVPCSDLEDRIDPRPYRSHRLDLRSMLAAMGASRVGDLAQVAGGNPVPSDLFVPSGVPLIKNGDIKADGFKQPTTNSVTQEFHHENPRYWAREGMVVVSLDGEIRALSFLPEDLPAHVNQRVAMLTVHGMPPALLAVWINHPVVQEQMHSWSVQTTVEHISNAIVEASLIPRLSAAEEARLGRAASSARRAGHSARKLVWSARFLVEALIERKVTEAELIEAGKDPDADRALLARLAEDGFDGAGAPLFSDLDELAELIAEANRTGGES